MHSKTLGTLALLASSLVSAQTFTECDPTKKDCPPDPAVARSVEVDFTKGENDFFKVADGTKLKYDPARGAVFGISNEKQAPTISSPEYIFFGKLEVELQAAPGVGIVTSCVLQSDDLDEIDWEWVGGSPNKVQTNYFSKGDTTTYDRGATHDVPESTSQFHTYTVEWTRECIKWEINGVEVRRLNFADAKGGTTYPQTPMQVKLGSWVAGRKDAPKGTVEWSGGYANFDNGPVDAFYRKVVVTDYMGGGGETGVKSYVYGDKTGTWESIILDKEGGGLENKGKDDSSESDDEKTGSSTATVGSKNGTTGGSKTAGDGSLPSNTGASEVQVPGAAPKASLALAGLLLSGSAILLNLFV